MPTVLRLGSYRFHFYSDEMKEPPHVHVETPEGECKFWLNPARLARNKGISPRSLRDRDTERLIFEHQGLLKEKYDEFHDR